MAPVRNPRYKLIENLSQDKRGVLLFPKIIHGHTHVEYISSRSHNGLVFSQGTQVIDLCGWVTPVGEPVNSEASVMEALVVCSNIMGYRTDIQYLVFYIASFQKWKSTNNIPKPLQAAATSQYQFTLSFWHMCH